MRTLLFLLTVPLVLAWTFVSEVGAVTYNRYRHYGHHHYYRGGYYEHRLEAQRFGSRRWWDIYDEQRGRGR